MAKRLSRVAAGASMALMIVAGSAPCVAAGASRPAFAALGARTSVPYGWVDFCNRYAPECDGPALQPVDIDYSAKAMSDFERITGAVNRAIEPQTDAEHWGVVDRWDYPLDGRGDCEDYALLKRKLLIEAGYPRQALLMTVVRDLDGDGHAILTVKTSRGEFVLDNLNDRVKLWSETGYRFVKRQSQQDPNVWQTIEVPSPDQLVSAR
jgi:predicted transglutaminase-like cysteine proteinase